VQEAIDFLEYIAGEGRRMIGETTTSELPTKMHDRETAGRVVGCITPWNFPLAFQAGSWGRPDHREYGCVQTFEPDSLCAVALVEILQEAAFLRVC